MNITCSNLFWNESVGIIKKYPYLSHDKKCDVLVIGGGIGGALTAFMQAKQGVNVIVVDKNVLGYGSTIVSDGTLEARIDFNPKITKNIDEKTINKCNNLCMQALSDINEIIKEILNDEECKKYSENLGFRTLDLLYYSRYITNKISMYKTFEKIGKVNKDIEYLEEDPLINLRTGIIFPSKAIAINPYVFTQLIFMYLNKLENVEIYENTEIVNIVSKDDIVECITNNNFKIYSTSTILTNGIQLLEYLKEDSLTLNKTFTVVTEKIDSLDLSLTQVIAKDVNIPNTTISFTEDKRIILSGEDVKQNERLLNDKYNTNFANGKYKKMYINLRRLINLDNDIKIAKCFNGMYLATKDSLPIIDEIEDVPNLYCNLGAGKNGIIYSMIGARMLRNISKQYHIKDMYLFRENR